MTNRNLRKRVLYESRKWIGTPYIHQASTIGQGADCLGLVRGIWRKLYGFEPQPLPAYSVDWGEVSARESLLEASRLWFKEIEPDDARAGDLAIFRWKKSAIAKHVGILSGNGCLIHAYERTGVIETVLGRQWNSRIAGTFRFPSPESNRG